MLQNAPADLDIIGQGYVSIEFGPDDRYMKILVTTTPQPRGGRRAWFSCPACGRRCAVLWLPTRYSSERFACRRCHRLCYRSQMVSCGTRWRLQAAKLYARAGTTSGASYHYKPKRMRWPTFNRLIERAEDYETAAGNLVFASSRWLLGLIGMGGDRASIAHNTYGLARHARHPSNYSGEASQAA